MELCNDEQKATITEKSALTEAALDAEIAAHEEELKGSDTELEELLKSLQAQYEVGLAPHCLLVVYLCTRVSECFSLLYGDGGSRC